jgi:hypothetical protein
MTKKASLEGKGRSILLGEESSEPLPVPLSELEGELEAEDDGIAEAKETAPEDKEAIDWSGMMEDEVAAAGAVETEAEEEETSLPTIEHYYPEESVEPEPDLPAGAAVGETEPAAVTSVAPADPVASEIEEVGLGGHPDDNGDVDWGPMVEDEVTTAESPEGMTVPTIEHFYPPEEPALPESELKTDKEPAAPTPEPAPKAVPEGPPASPQAEQPPAEAAAETPAPGTGIRLGGLLVGTDLTQEVAPPGPGFKEIEVRETDKVPPADLTEEEEEIVIGRVTRTQRRELRDRISTLYREVPKKLAASGLEAKRKEALLLLSEARDLELEDPRQFDEAEYKVAQVVAIIANAIDVERWSHHYGNRLIAYLSTWFALMIAGVIFFNPLAAWLEEITSVTPLDTLPITVPPLLFTMMWGSIGGIIGGFYSLWRHIAEEQDFDKQYTVWYTLQPISGLVLGGIIHVIVLTGFLSMFSQVPGAEMSAAQESRAVQWFPALLAVVAGFRPNFVYALLSQIVELIGRREDE